MSDPAEFHNVGYRSSGHSITWGISFFFFGCYCLIHSSTIESSLPESIPSHSLSETSSLNSLITESTVKAKHRLVETLGVLRDDPLKFGFGHQEDNYYGQNWSYSSTMLRKRSLNQSDVFTNVADYPMLMGYDAEDFLNGKPLMEYVSWAAHKGIAINFLWSAQNPANDGEEVDTRCHGYHLVEELLPGGVFNHKWKRHLDHLAAHFDNFTFKGTDVHVPFIFRPFHEMNGDWYWWGTGCNSASALIAAFNYTRWYIEDYHGMDQILWMFCPSSVSSSSVSNFREYYPGNNTVDIVGFDRYSTEHDFIDKMKADCREMKNFSVHEGKLLAVAEVGITGGIQDITNNPSWFHSDFSSVIRDECDTAAYALTFSNYKSDHYWIPLKGQETYRGFKKMYEGSNTVFLSGELWAKSSYSVYVQKLLS